MGFSFIDTSAIVTSQPLKDWGLLTEPITNAAGQQIHYAQGKTLGGSSAINTMSYVRGRKGSYDKWAEVEGDNDYMFENMLPYFRKSVHLTPPDEPKRNNSNVTVVYDPAGFSDNGGPLQVSWNNYVDPTITWLTKIIEEGAGLSLSDVGFQKGELVGHGAWLPGTIEPIKGQRSSSENSFLAGAIPNTGITVYILTQATKIIFDDVPIPHATGVTVNSLGAEYKFWAKKVAPAADGVGLDIPVVSRLDGVDQNLHDPIQIFAAYQLNTPSAQTLVGNPELEPEILQHLHNGSGPYSSAAGYMAFEPIPSAYRARLSNNTLAKLAVYSDD
ncbi:Versicolorin B synthase [Cytospora mali]|uniref:Versicolorin B synthase n=1 Tax=Cytospora mali TaxID=578113 RepID=A0A194VJJ6_CYTMA|nr:Versicolorin B synthase [Valsa mali]